MALVTAAQELSGLLDVRPADTGMHLIGWLPPGVNEIAVSQQASECGVEALPLSLYGVEASQRNGLLLGYTAVNLSEIRQGVHCLKAALRNPAIAH